MIWVLIAITFAIALYIHQARKRALRTNQHLLVCPHCGIRGGITRSQDLVKGPISGGKATGAILTGGLSLLVTGLSRKTRVTLNHCRNCNTNWHS
jgi:hypothetical protein